MRHSIEVPVGAVVNYESAQFAAFLNAQGYKATVGRDDSGSVDGVACYADENAARVLDDLWTAYCNGDAVPAEPAPLPAGKYDVVTPGYYAAHREAVQFALYLNLNGHRAVVGDGQHGAINGVSCAADPQAAAIMQALWNEYCRMV